MNRPLKSMSVIFLPSVFPCSLYFGSLFFLGLTPRCCFPCYLQHAKALAGQQNPWCLTYMYLRKSSSCWGRWTHERWHRWGGGWRYTLGRRCTVLEEIPLRDWGCGWPTPGQGHPWQITAKANPHGHRETPEGQQPQVIYPSSGHPQGTVSHKQKIEWHFLSYSPEEHPLITKTC